MVFFLRHLTPCHQSFLTLRTFTHLRSAPRAPPKSFQRVQGGLKFNQVNNILSEVQQQKNLQQVCPSKTDFSIDHYDDDGTAFSTPSKKEMAPTYTSAKAGAENSPCSSAVKKLSLRRGMAAR